MVLQLAYYRTAGEFSATYETALTRMFKHGRTETIRSYTAEAREWVLAMCASPGERVSYLNLRARAQLTYIRRTTSRTHANFARFSTPRCKSIHDSRASPQLDKASTGISWASVLCSDH